MQQPTIVIDLERLPPEVAIVDHDPCARVGNFSWWQRGRGRRGQYHHGRGQCGSQDDEEPGLTFIDFSFLSYVPCRK